MIIDREIIGNYSEFDKKTGIEYHKYGTHFPYRSISLGLHK